MKEYEFPRILYSFSRDIVSEVFVPSIKENRGDLIAALVGAPGGIFLGKLIDQAIRPEVLQFPPNNWDMQMATLAFYGGLGTAALFGLGNRYLRSRVSIPNN